jgi:hypothetical protein
VNKSQRASAAERYETRACARPAAAICDRRRFSTAALISAWLGGCSGSGVGLDSNGQPLVGSSTGAALPLSADFDSIQANVFTPICSVCHIGATAPQGLMLDASHSYNLLVNIPSTEVPSILRVKPGDPGNSYIIQKLQGHAAVGGQMPLGETPLAASTIAFIVQWITDGAQPGASASATDAKFRVASVVPGDDDVLSVPPSSIVISFTRELDASRIDDTLVRLERIDGASGDAAAPAPTATSIAVTAPAANPRVLLLIPRSPLLAGRYQVVLGGLPGAALSARDAQPIVMPAVDVSGDRIISRFTVATTP